MSRIYVEFAGMQQLAADIQAISERVSAIRSDFQGTMQQLDWEVAYQSDINKTANYLGGKLDQYVRVLQSYQRFVADAYNQYAALDTYETRTEGFRTEDGPYQPDLVYTPGGGKADSKETGEKQPAQKEEQDSIAEFIKDILGIESTLGNNDEAGILKDLISYAEDFTEFFRGDKSGMTGAGNWCNLADSSVSVWKGLYDYCAGRYDGLTTGFFGEAAQYKVKVLAAGGSVLGLIGSIFAAGSGQNEKTNLTKAADYVGCTKGAISVGKSIYELRHLKDVSSLAKIKAGPWNPLDIYSAIATSGVSTVEQAIRSCEEYSKDGKWDMKDTGATGIDAAMEGLFGLTHALTFGLDNVIYGAVDRLSGGSGNDGRSYAEKAADGLKGLAEEAGNALGNLWLKLTRKK